jgi:hypothetical protein
MFVSMRMPVELVAAVDERAASEGRSRSAVLRRLAEEEFDWERSRRGKTSLQVAVKQQPAPEPAKVGPEVERESLCKKEGHSGFWRSDGYWCISCRHLYRD